MATKDADGTLSAVHCLVACFYRVMHTFLNKNRFNSNVPLPDSVTKGISLRYSSYQLKHS